jgi:hypothetical protein
VQNLCAEWSAYERRNEGENEGRVIAIQSLSNAELIKLLQFEIGDVGLMEMVEAELERRKTEGTKQ